MAPCHFVPARGQPLEFDKSPGFHSSVGRIGSHLVNTFDKTDWATNGCHVELLLVGAPFKETATVFIDVFGLENLWHDCVWSSCSKGVSSYSETSEITDISLKH